jgi:hypothetical protein
MGLIGKLFGRRPLVVPPPEPMFVRPPEPDFEEDWDWQIAYARNRPKTEPVVRRAAVHAAVRAVVQTQNQPRTVIPVPTLPVATDPSQVRLRQDTRPVSLPMPRHARFARGTDRHDTQQVTVVRSASQPPPLPPQLRTRR